MTGLLTVLAVALYVGGASLLFRTRAAARRLLGIGTMGAGGLLLTAVAGPGRGAGPATALVGAITFAGLLLVARAMERTWRGQDDADLRIDVDPLRWP